MELKQMSLLHYLIACHVLILTLATAQNSTTNSTSISITKPGCPKQCGNVTVPYPFGFELNCNTSDDGSQKLLLGSNNVVYNISDAEFRISNSIGWGCYNFSGAVLDESLAWTTFLETDPYSFSARNRFTVVGCDDYVSIAGPNNFEYGCNVSCTSRGDVIEGECMGKGCCQKQIPKGLKYYNTTMSSTQNHTDVWSFNSCGYAFLGEADRFRFQGLPDLGDDLNVDYFYERIKATKVADFGASRLIPLDQTHVATSILGTSGYLDPEYFRTSRLTEKSDVYSFGVVLAELLTGLKPIIRARNEEDKNLANFFVLSMNKNSLFHIIDRRVLREGSLEQLQKMAEVVKNCLRPHGEDRPTMKEVAIELEGLRKITGVSWSNQYGLEENDQDELSDLYTVPINSNGNTPNSDSSRIMHPRYSPS
ncbi:hypothetical protein H5410_064972 [Solanum commersonii]|uniref:Protein kinase domain-containing protein n=1 Tax=Solanum commersonii TaxID=4109 RepID=A0A9J5VXV7_SOLCO|nr:hypothetical protein H5410_064972 [Solanum commersonii]